MGALPNHVNGFSIFPQTFAVRFLGRHRHHLLLKEKKMPKRSGAMGLVSFNFLSVEVVEIRVVIVTPFSLNY